MLMNDKDREAVQVVLTAILFGIRLFKGNEDTMLSASPEQQTTLKEWEAQSRTEAADRSALDAAAIIEAIDRVIRVRQP